MKKIVCTFCVVISSVGLFAQNGRGIPEAEVKDLKGSSFNTKNLSNEGKPMVINFWATWCTPCKKELNNIAEVYDEWQEETGVKIVAVSIDDTRNMSKVAPYVNSKSWEYEVYLDPNGDFKRALNVNNVPHTFLINGKGEIVWQHNSYSEGDEHELYELIKKLSKGETIE
ncbi:MAG: TlpA family protein disulfide reductase [Flavobacteriales bacterium]|nr:TlpA family protein disulfide reductase [Flavobacteriales bacterium]